MSATPFCELKPHEQNRIKLFFPDSCEGMSFVAWMKSAAKDSPEIAREILAFIEHQKKLAMKG